MSHEDEAVAGGKRAHRIEPQDGGTEQYAAQPGGPHAVEMELDRFERGRYQREVEAVPARAGICVRHRVPAPEHSLAESREVGHEVLVILDQVSAAERELAGDAGVLRHREPTRLERGGEQGSPADPGNPPQPLYAEPGSRKLGGDLGRQREIGETHLGIQRHVAVEKVEKLRKLSVREIPRVADDDAVGGPGAARLGRLGRLGGGIEGRDRLDPPEHPLAHHGVRHQVRRQLHGLLVGDAAGEFGHLARGRSHFVGREDAVGIAHRGIVRAARPFFHGEEAPASPSASRSGPRCRS